jgi:NADPH:quinone reductase
VKAYTLDGFEAERGLRDDVAAPDVADNGLLVRVQASSVNPVDVFIAAGGLKAYAEYEFPVTLGRDFSGVVERVGSAVTRYAAGDEVFGFVLHANPAVHDGSWAELIRVPRTTRSPEGRAASTSPLGHAGAAPLAGISALAAYDALAPDEGETVLVVGATGGVGSFFVQLAAATGAAVIAPAIPRTTTICAAWASPISSTGAGMSPRACASFIRRAWTRSSTSSRRRRTARC